MDSTTIKGRVFPLDGRWHYEILERDAEGKTINVLQSSIGGCGMHMQETAADYADYLVGLKRRQRVESNA